MPRNSNSNNRTRHQTSKERRACGRLNRRPTSTKHTAVTAAAAWAAHGGKVTITATDAAVPLTAANLQRHLAVIASSVAASRQASPLSILQTRLAPWLADTQSAPPPPDPPSTEPSQGHQHWRPPCPSTKNALEQSDGGQHTLLRCMDRSRYLDINGHEQHSSGHYPYYDNAEARSRAIAKTTDKDLDDAYHQPAPSSVPDSTNSERRITLKPRPVPKNIKKRLGIFNKGKLGKITHPSAFSESSWVARHDAHLHQQGAGQPGPPINASSAVRPQQPDVVEKAAGQPPPHCPPDPSLTTTSGRPSTGPRGLGRMMCSSMMTPCHMQNCPRPAHYAPFVEPEPRRAAVPPMLLPLQQRYDACSSMMIQPRYYQSSQDQQLQSATAVGQGGIAPSDSSSPFHRPAHCQRRCNCHQHLWADMQRSPPDCRLSMGCGGRGLDADDTLPYGVTSAPVADKIGGGDDAARDAGVYGMSATTLNRIFGVDFVDNSRAKPKHRACGHRRHYHHHHRRSPYQQQLQRRDSGCFNSPNSGLPGCSNNWYCQREHTGAEPTYNNIDFAQPLPLPQATFRARHKGLRCFPQNYSTRMLSLADEHSHLQPPPQYKQQQCSLMPTCLGSCGSDGCCSLYC